MAAASAPGPLSSCGAVGREGSTEISLQSKSKLKIRKTFPSRNQFSNLQKLSYLETLSPPLAFFTRRAGEGN